MRRLPTFFLLCALGIAGTASCRKSEAPPQPAQTAPPEPAFAPAIQPADVPTQGTTAQPMLTASSRGVILSWLEQQDLKAILKYTELSGGAWSPAKTIASSEHWFVSDADVPTVMRMSNGTLVATSYPSVKPDEEAYDLLLSYSKDEGKTWSRTISPHHDKTRTQHGFASLFEMADHSLGLVWLDGREGAKKKNPEDAGQMDLYFASFDPSWKQTAETAVNAGTCECCQTTVAVTDEGPIAAFRDRTDKDIRDIHVTRLENGKWSDAQVVHADNWQIDACPVNGPALSARGKTVVAAWFTAVNDNGRAYAAFSTDAGRSWGQPIRLDDDTSLGHVDIELLDDGSAVATWVEFTNDRAQFRMRKVLPTGAKSKAVVIAGQGDAHIAGYPRMTRLGDDLVFAWTQSGGNGAESQQVKAAVARVQ